MRSVTSEPRKPFSLGHCVASNTQEKEKTVRWRTVVTDFIPNYSGAAREASLSSALTATRKASTTYSASSVDIPGYNGSEISRSAAQSVFGRRLSESLNALN